MVKSIFAILIAGFLSVNLIWADNTKDTDKLNNKSQAVLINKEKPILQNSNSKFDLKGKNFEMIREMNQKFIDAKKNSKKANPKPKRKKTK